MLADNKPSDTGGDIIRGISAEEMTPFPTSGEALT